MLKAVVSRGEIRLLEPLPAEWREGQPLVVDKADELDGTLAEIDRDFAELTRLCQDREPEEESRFDRALQEARAQAKEQVRRSMRA